MLEIVEQIADIVDGFAVILLVGGVLFAFSRCVLSLLRKPGNRPTTIRQLRIDMGQVILLALEILIVSDILHSIAHRTLQDLGMLAIIVAIRFALSFMLEREIEHLKREEDALKDREEA